MTSHVFTRPKYFSSRTKCAGDGWRCPRKPTLKVVGLNEHHHAGGYWCTECYTAAVVQRNEAWRQLDDFRKQIVELSKEARALRGRLVATYSNSDCTGDAVSCPVDECSMCSVRDCPVGEPLHYHHDGCPYCTTASR